MFNAISGKKPIQGKLPVTIPNTQYKTGDGILVETLLRNASNEFAEKYDLSGIDKKMKKAVNNQIFPGGVLLIGKEGLIIYEKPFGNFTFEKNSTPVNTDAIFDLASLTKVVGTTTAAMLLYDENKLSLDKKVSEYLPRFANNGKENITVRNLLEHNSGLIAYRNLYKKYLTKEEALESIYNEKLEYPTGSKNVYSDFNMIILQQIIEKLSSKSLDQYLKEKVFDPLNMKRTMFNPPREFWYYTPPTSNAVDKKKRNKGVVHDGNAFLFNGVAGHAGLFSTADDLAVFAQMILQDGKFGNKQLIKPSTVQEWTKKQSSNSSRALGWDTKSVNGSSAGNLFSENSFGHTGFTGTSLWIDKEKNLFVILLTNRTYPDGKNEAIKSFRPEIHDTIIKVLDEAGLN
jgi:CubicO group peptidase (beta-lactamase class C family)